MKAQFTAGAHYKVYFTRHKGFNLANEVRTSERVLLAFPFIRCFYFQVKDAALPEQPTSAVQTTNLQFLIPLQIRRLAFFFNLKTKLQRTFVKWNMSRIRRLKTILNYTFTICFPTRAS